MKVVAINNRAVNVFVVMLCQSFQTVSVAGIALFLPSIRSDLDLSFTQAGTLSAALLFQAGLALLASWFGAQRRATAMGLSLVGIFAGQLLINALGPWLVEYFGWRFPFISFGFVGILASFIYLRLGQESQDTQSREKLRIADALRLFRHRFMWVCGIIQYVRLGVMRCIAFWLPTLLIDEQGLALQVTGSIIALRTLLIAPSNLLGGYIRSEEHT